MWQGQVQGRGWRLLIFAKGWSWLEGKRWRVDDCGMVHTRPNLSIGSFVLTTQHVRLISLANSLKICWASYQTKLLWFPVGANLIDDSSRFTIRFHSLNSSRQKKTNAQHSLRFKLKSIFINPVLKKRKKSSHLMLYGQDKRQKIQM